ncbi:hypothetical protein, partial [uncultured Campylobacter sp.]|uniref:hypothetical protein n=1 Tax=uncultured Campylobacter sp. TaxID=218934 RepID=UPI002626B490
FCGRVRRHGAKFMRDLHVAVRVCGCCARTDFKIYAQYLAAANESLLASRSLPFCTAPAVCMSSFGLRAAR